MTVAGIGCGGKRGYNVKLEHKAIAYDDALNILRDLYFNGDCTEGEKEQIFRAALSIKEAYRLAEHQELTVTWLRRVQLTPYAPNMAMRRVVYVCDSNEME